MDLSLALAALRRGHVIVFPTETLYGLGADALDDQAVEKVFELKGRNPKIPIPVLVANQAMLDALIDEIPPLAQKLMERFWPGPLTIVLPSRPGTPKQLLNGTGGIGVRISSQPVATQLVRELGRPLTATSANPSGRQAASTLQQAEDYFADRIHVFIDGGILPSRTGSSVIEIVENRIKIIREGEISSAELAAVSGEKNFLR